MTNQWKICRTAVGIGAAFLSTSLFATETPAIGEQDWGIAAMYRIASVPFDTDRSDQSVSTFVPMMYFNNEYVFIDGLEGGVHLYETDDEQWQVNALTRLRFVDIPKYFQNANEGDSADFGLQLRYKVDDNWHFDTEVMTDDEYRVHGNLRMSGEFESGDWEVKPSVTLRYKEAEFNSVYYGFSEYTNDRIGAGVDINVGVEARYHVVSNLYLLGSTSITRLDDNAYNAPLVEDRYQGELFVGFGFFNDKTKAPKSELSNKRYWRVAHGWATPSNIGEIFGFESEKDEYNNQLTSVFYGHPLTDELFGFPIDIYLTPGLVHHWSSEVQGASTEYVAAIKAYYTFNWPTQWRFGVAEGLSYIDNVTYIEQDEMDRKGYTASHLLNYLDFSFDVNVGELFNAPELNNMWFGYSLHHRSAIFEKASQFGRIKGGSNYNTVYLQFDF
ncbi:MltA-interacting MipA family protein [Vibrio sinaloensis]|uniref:MipA/OmpV family protein n=1 Tax=Photobacterium sp. (strain ATCC 43367) TaxID=379097 RepID=UPI00057E37CA|nr:MipA/OmpV family protein [Vibrio sinaloensis]KIE19723.1 MltA-interacting MipA family protein [Vibrio sinaloensis]